jgi:hypothetical protein
VNNFPRTWQLSALILLGAGLKLPAQELTFLGGLLPETGTERSSYTWQVDYRQDFYRNFAGSIAYINEGHLRRHYRDGTAFEVWGSLPLFEDHLSIAQGRSEEIMGAVCMGGEGVVDLLVE